MISSTNISSTHSMFATFLVQDKRLVRAHLFLRIARPEFHIRLHLLKKLFKQSMQGTIWIISNRTYSKNEAYKLLIPTAIILYCISETQANTKNYCLAASFIALVT